MEKECKLSFDKWSWQLAKIPPQELSDFAAELIRRGVETQQAPVPDALAERRTYLESRVPKVRLLEAYDSILGEMGDKFRSYQSETGDDVTKQSIAEWLLQFNSEDIPSALRILEHVRFWDRAAMMDAFSMGLDHLGAEALEAQWVPLGGGTTSSHLLNYLMADLKRLGKCPTAVLGSANDLQDAGRVIFYDENVYSATQSRTVFRQWLGRPREEWLVNEKHVDPLADTKLAILRKAKIDFLFLVGRRDGLRALTEAVKDLLGHGNVDGHIVAPDETSCFREAACVFDNKDSIEKARNAFEWAGRKALADKKGIWEDAKIEDRLLGYSNPGGLNVFFYNVPTSTVTALWRTCQQSSWMALFPRRRRE